MDYKHYDVNKLKELVASGDIVAIKTFMSENDLELVDGVIKPKNKERIAHFKERHAFYDRRQLIRKINLNSIYGSLTNAGSLFFDQRLGQSITLSGRCITRQMGIHLNKLLDGVADHTGKCILYGDTDSIYFSANPVREKLEKQGLSFDKETMIKFYDTLGDSVNDMLPPFVEEFFNAAPENAKVIQAGREVVGLRGLFVKKKRYAILVYDNEGKREDVGGKLGKLKVMGMETKRSDTPEYCQKFLESLLHETLTTGEQAKVIDKIRDFRKEFRARQPWEQGSPKGMNGLTVYTQAFDAYKSGKTQKAPRMPGHIKAAYNYNMLRKSMNDRASLEIEDGMKIWVCRLKPNAMDIETIAIPVDLSIIPKWIKQLPYDTDLMESKMIDKKVDNLLWVLNWDILDESKDLLGVDDLFGF